MAVKIISGISFGFFHLIDRIKEIGENTNQASTYTKVNRISFDFIFNYSLKVASLNVYL